MRMKQVVNMVSKKEMKLKEAKRIGQGVGLIIAGTLTVIFSVLSLLSGNFFAQFTLVLGFGSMEAGMLTR